MKRVTDELFEPLITIPRLAKRAETSANTIYELIYSGRLKAIQLQVDNEDGKRRNWRIPLKSWEKFVNESQPGNCPCGRSA